MAASPALLISIRNTNEAKIAALSPASVIDLKEPSHGPLGMPTLQTISEIVQELNSQKNASNSLSPIGEVGGFGGPGGLSAGATVFRARCQQRQLTSLACGELFEWEGRSTASLAVLPKIDYLKIGLARMQGRDWQSLWAKTRTAVESSLAFTPSWIAVAYADHERAHSPDPIDVISMAEATGCSGVLFDTFDKSGSGLLGSLAPEKLRGYVERIRSSGMIAALAGRVMLADLPTIKSLEPDVVGIRSAACLDGDRAGTLAAQPIEAFNYFLCGEQREPIRSDEILKY